VANGEIAPPKKRTLTTKLRTELTRITGMIPKDLKHDADVIERTEKALLKFLAELKDIWGLNKIKPLEDELKKKFRKLEDAAA
jgi:hypothetical protein